MPRQMNKLRFRLAKFIWAGKLLRTKHFVVMTDKSSAIVFNGLNPDKFEDVLLLHQQTAALTDFSIKVEELLRHHKEAIKLLEFKEERNETRRKTTKRATDAKAKKATAPKVRTK